MEDIDALKNYFKKLQRTLTYNVDFKFFGIGLIKKNKIDDILCCILAKMPKSYKILMNIDEKEKRQSIVAYKRLFSLIKQKFPLNSKMYLIEPERACDTINTILKTIEDDVNYAEKHV